MLRFICVVAFVVANVDAFTQQQANRYIDYILETPYQTEVQYGRLDPYKFPDIHIDLISKRIQDNKAVLTKGKLLKLSQVRRSSDCTVPHWTSANVSFTCFLSFDNLVVNYTANVSYDNTNMVFYPTTSISGTNMTIQVTTTPEENIPNMRLLVINNIGKMVVTTKMLSIGDIAEIVGPSIREGIVRNSTINLHRAINGRFRDALGFSIYKTPVPFLDY